MRKERRILDRLNKTNLNKQNANRQNLHSAANYYPPSLQNTRPHFCLEAVHCRKEHKYIATLLVMDPDFIRDLQARKTILNEIHKQELLLFFMHLLKKCLVEKHGKLGSAWGNLITRKKV